MPFLFKQVDQVKELILLGYGRVAKRVPKMLADLHSDYENAQKEAKMNRVGMWIYGDVTDDDAVC